MDNNKMIWALLIGGVGYFLYKKEQDKKAKIAAMQRSGVAPAPAQRKAGGFGGGGGGSAAITPTTPIIAGTQTSGTNPTPDINIQVGTPEVAPAPLELADEPAFEVADPIDVSGGGGVPDVDTGADVDTGGGAVDPPPPPPPPPPADDPVLDTGTTSGFVDFDGDFDYMSKGDWQGGRSKTDFDGEFN